MTHHYSRHFLGVSTCTGFALMFLSQTPPAFAQTICGLVNTVTCVVPGGTTLGSVSNSGNDAGVTNQGDVTGTVLTDGTNSSIFNSGTVGADLQTDEDNSPITNTGSVVGEIIVNGENSDVNNSGYVGYQIRTYGDGSGVINSGVIVDDISTLFRDSEVTNSGTVGTDIRTWQDDSPVINTGRVGTYIDTFGDRSHITNSGTVGTYIETGARDTDVINSGSVGTYISTRGIGSDIVNSGSVGAYIRSGRLGITTGSDVTNSGFVGTGDAGDGIFLDGDEAHLTLLRGSVIRGTIDFAGGGTQTLEVGNGLSVNATFTTPPTAIEPNGALFAASGNRAVIVDPTNLSTQDAQLADLTGGISTALENRLSRVRSGTGGALSTSGPVDGAMRGDPGQLFWMGAFGSFRRQEASSPSAETQQWVGGVVIGVDNLLRDNLRAGFLGGTAAGGVDAEFDAQKTDSQSFFVGSYASLLKAGLVFDTALTGGYSTFEQERSVANNLAATGLETATADFGGWFISPELSVTKPAVLWGHPLEGSLGLRYSGLFLDGFSESGTSAPLTVDGRSDHIGVARLQLAAPYEKILANGAAFRHQVKTGLQARSTFGGQTIDGALLGQNVSFTPGGDDNTLGAYGSVSGEYVTQNAVVIGAGGEGLLEADGAYRISARTSLEYRF
ncbi:MAG: autotransporter domain-containing protein [Stappiaceae bacterium]